MVDIAKVISIEELDEYPGRKPHDRNKVRYYRISLRYKSGIYNFIFVYDLVKHHLFADTSPKVCSYHGPTMEDLKWDDIQSLRNNEIFMPIITSEAWLIAQKDSLEIAKAWQYSRHSN